jgi:hypothetical protein
MLTEITIELATLRFDGDRFRAHSLDIECTRELLSYRTIVLECARALWRRRHPGNVPLPRRLEDGFRLHFDQVAQGSAVIPLRRVHEYEPETSEPSFVDEIDEAARLIDSIILAAHQQRTPPDNLPDIILPLFSELGKTLRQEETLYVRARGSVIEAACDSAARVRLFEWAARKHETGAEHSRFPKDRPIWEQLVAIGKSAPPGTWDNVPTDLSMNIDHYLYHRKRDDR